MKKSKSRYRVGQRLIHPQFGTGLIVDIRQGHGSGVIEVVFGTDLKRLSALVEWPLAEESGPSRRGKPKEESALEVEIAEIEGQENGSSGGNGDSPRLHIEPVAASNNLVDRWLDGEWSIPLSSSPVFVPSGFRRGPPPIVSSRSIRCGESTVFRTRCRPP